MPLSHRARQLLHNRLGINFCEHCGRVTRFQRYPIILGLNLRQRPCITPHDVILLDQAHPAKQIVPVRH